MKLVFSLFFLCQLAFADLVFEQYKVAWARAKTESKAKVLVDESLKVSIKWYVEECIIRGGTLTHKLDTRYFCDYDPSYYFEPASCSLGAQVWCKKLLKELDQ
jgi:hypothetical protein